MCRSWHGSHRRGHDRSAFCTRGSLISLRVRQDPTTRIIRILFRQPRRLIGRQEIQTSTHPTSTASASCRNPGPSHAPQRRRGVTQHAMSAAAYGATGWPAPVGSPPRDTRSRSCEAATNAASTSQERRAAGLLGFDREGDHPDERRACSHGNRAIRVDARSINSANASLSAMAKAASGAWPTGPGRMRSPPPLMPRRARRLSQAGPILGRRRWRAAAATPRIPSTSPPMDGTEQQDSPIATAAAMAKLAAAAKCTSGRRLPSLDCGVLLVAIPHAAIADAAVTA